MDRYRGENGRIELKLLLFKDAPNRVARAVQLNAGMDERAARESMALAVLEVVAMAAMIDNCGNRLF